MNILIFGGAGTGKTYMANMLSAAFRVTLEKVVVYDGIAKQNIQHLRSKEHHVIVCAQETPSIFVRLLFDVNIRTNNKPK